MPELWQVELEEIRRRTSPEAKVDTWAGVLAGLSNVEDGKLFELALKAQALAATERDPGLKAALEERIDQIVLERRGSLKC